MVVVSEVALWRLSLGQFFDALNQTPAIHFVEAQPHMVSRPYPHGLKDHAELFDRILNA